MTAISLLEDTVLFTITSVPVTRSDGKSGVYEHIERTNAFMFSQVVDKSGYVKHLISTALAGCAFHTGMPVGEGIYQVSVEREVAIACGIPMEFKA